MCCMARAGLCTAPHGRRCYRHECIVFIPFLLVVALLYLAVTLRVFLLQDKRSGLPNIKLYMDGGTPKGDGVLTYEDPNAAHKSVGAFTGMHDV